MQKKNIFSCYYSFHINLGAVNCLCPANSRDLIISEEYSEEPDPPGSLLFLEAANELMIEHELQFPESIEDAVYICIC